MGAVDPFEIQVYDATANSPGVPGIELHVNRVFDGVRAAASPELPAHHQTHFTLEPSLGIFPFLELGAYVQTALNADGSFAYAGTKLVTRYDANRWGGEIRPIVAWDAQNLTPLSA